MEEVGIILDDMSYLNGGFMQEECEYLRMMNTYSHIALSPSLDSQRMDGFNLAQ